MRTARFRHIVVLFPLILGVMLAAPVGSNAAAGSNQIKFLLNAGPAFNPFTCALGSIPCASRAEQQWMHEHYWRMRGYAPWYDSHFRSASAIHWAPPSHVYADLYGISRDRSLDQPDARLFNKHPDWALRDRADRPHTASIEGNRLYIPYQCDDPGPGCPQFAADVGKPAYRDWWIARLRGILSRGYVGVYIDDVNMDWRVADASGEYVKPWDPRTGKRMTLANWRRYVARFTEMIRRAFPGMEIVHNGFYWVDNSNPEVQRETAAANFLELERGFDDAGLQGGPPTDRFAYQRLLTYIDWLHARGKSVILEPHFNRPTMSGEGPNTAVMTARAEHEIAGYFLVKERRDAIAIFADFASNPPREDAPNNWSPIWETDLGQPLGPRYVWNGVVRRDFADGFVLVNLPERPERTIDLGGTYRRLDGSMVTSVTLRRTPLPWQSPALTPADEQVSQGAVLQNP